jgi:three-Cys-motif partner protein
MAVPQKTVWRIDPHTEAKHEILRRYLGAWFGIMGSRNSELVYVDGFCGPGEYEGGEPGSPLIALNAAAGLAAKQKPTVTFWFIDNRQDRIDHLRRKLAGLQCRMNFVLKVDCGDFEDAFGAELEKTAARGVACAPTFAFLDPFGFKGMPYKVAARLLGQQKCEVFVNLSVESINRFLEHPNDSIREHIVNAFGTDRVLEIPDREGDRTEMCRILYQHQLEKCARYVRFFEMRDKGNHVQYYLFFASNNRTGYVKMKEAMWKVDPDGEFKFSDRTDPTCITLFEANPIPAVKRVLLDRFRGQEVPCQKVRDYIETHTAYLATHMKAALREMEREGSLEVQTEKTDGTRRRAGSFPDEAALKFA